MFSRSAATTKRFIDAWNRTIFSTFLKKIVTPNYRNETPERRTGHGGAWRSVNPDASRVSWGKKAIRRHKQWSAGTRRSAAQLAALHALQHEEGRTAPKALSARAYHRAAQRILVKHRIA